MEPKLREAERRIEEARRTRSETLVLGDLALRELPASLGDLPDLRRLYLGGGLPIDYEGPWRSALDFPEFTGLTPIATLQGLQTLNLAGCYSVTNLSPLSGLAGLQSLYLGSCGKVMDLSPLSGLSGLQSLNLGSCGKVMDLSPLSGLAGLQSLDLRYCWRVTNLSPLSGLSGLQSLYLEGCRGVRDLSPLVGLAGLQRLSLTYTYVWDLSPLSGLAALRGLDLYTCGPAIPKELLQVLARRLNRLVADKAVGVPREVLSKESWDDCLPRLRAFFSELDLAPEAENEVKIILLGNGRVGKTQLCRRFRSEPFDESVPSTHGVQIWREELRFQTGDRDQVFQINWWDFGGQDIYHGTHALFLRSRAVFLILWAPHLENRDDYEENGVPLRNQPLVYWLDYVRSLAGEDSPVIVVQSQCDTSSDRRSDPPRPAGAGFFECCAYSAKKDRGRETLENYLREAIRHLIDRTGTLQIGRGRARVRQKLYDWRQDDQPLKPEERQHRTLSVADFRALCDQDGGIVSWEHALGYFHQTGVVFYRRDLFSDRIVLDQNWALDAVYSVFHRGKTVPWLRDSGRFTCEDLAATVWQGHSIEEQKLFLGIMESCGVCFSCGKTARGEDRYIAPDLLPGFETVKGRLHAWKEDTDTYTLRLEYRFFHPAVIRGLMSRIGWQAGDLAEYWKYGLWFKDGKRDSQLLVQFEDQSTDAAPGAGALVLKAQGRDPVGLLREIRKAVLQRRIGEETKELLTLDGVAVDWSRLDREVLPDSKIDIRPEPLKAGEKPREVFISYAWGDDSPEGKIRGEVVDGLYEALEKDGFRPVRDRNAMQTGELISAFMRRITHADLVVAVISDKYLRSPYCMTEIHGLWQRSLEDAALMAERVVPIVLPDMKMERLRDRVPYVRYWREQLKEMKALHRELGLDLDLETHREARLVRNFAQDVAGILKFLQDVLMPRKLEAHLDNGFEAVREALRRRMGNG